VGAQGAQGSPGNQGPQGSTGDTGPDGDTGPQGPTGPAIPVYAYTITGLAGITSDNTGYTAVSYFEIPNLPSFIEVDTGYMAINWTIQATENSGNGKSQIYIDFYSNGVTYTPDAINAANGGIVLTSPMINNTGYGPDNIVSASANDYVNLLGYQPSPSYPMYCTLYQMSDVGTTTVLEKYNMSLTFVSIGSFGPYGPQGSPVQIIGGAYNP
jgi:hypothetical protein